MSPLPLPPLITLHEHTYMLHAQTDTQTLYHTSYSPCFSPSCYIGEGYLQHFIAFLTRSIRIWLKEGLLLKRTDKGVYSAYLHAMPFTREHLIK